MIITRSSQQTDYTYNDNSWVTGIDYPNDCDTDYTYNANGWMTALDAVHGQTTLLDLDYTYDFNGLVCFEQK